MGCHPGIVTEGPKKGTHSIAFTRAHGSNNWESQNALTVCLDPGTRVSAVGRGVVMTHGYGPWKVQGKRQGSRLHLQLDTGEVFFYGYLAQLIAQPGDHVVRGDVLGTSGFIRGRGALHFAAKPPVSPWAWYGSAWLPAGASGPQPSPGGGTQGGSSGTADATPDNTSIPSELEDAWHTLEYALRVTWPHSADAVKQATQDGHKAVYS